MENVSNTLEDDKAKTTQSILEVRLWAPDQPDGGSSVLPLLFFLGVSLKCFVYFFSGLNTVSVLVASLCASIVPNLLKTFGGIAQECTYKRSLS